MKKYFHSLFILLFVAACLIPAAGLAVNGPSPAAGNETPVRAPSLTRPDGSFNVEFLSDAADWFSRSFGFRREMITLDSGLKAGLFRTSPQSLVALGKGDWLYYAETLDDYTGADSLTPRQAWCIARSLRLAQDYVQSQGAAFAFTIAPNKASIYPEYLPDGLRPAGTEYSAPVVEALEEQGVHYADLFAPLRAQKADLEAERGPYYDPLYFTTDSHWTSFGAALGHDVLLDSLGLPDDSLFDPDGGFPGESWSGDLYEMLYPAASPAEREFCLTEGFSFQYTRPIRDVDDLRIETASASENGPLLMFRDSFGNALHRLMAGSFSSARFSRAVPYDLGQMEELGARYVAVEIVERNLPSLAQGIFLMPAPELAELPWDDDELYQPESLSGAPAQLEVFVNGNDTGLSGTVDAPCDPDSPVYLVLVDDPSTAWEAFPRWDAEAERTAFSACFDQEDSVAFDLELVNRRVNVVYRCNGQWVLALSEEVSHDPEYLAGRGLWLGEEE